MALFSASRRTLDSRQRSVSASVRSSAWRMRTAAMVISSAEPPAAASWKSRVGAVSPAPPLSACARTAPPASASAARAGIIGRRGTTSADAITAAASTSGAIASGSGRRLAT
jgi:hypothetical protein